METRKIQTVASYQAFAKAKKVNITWLGQARIAELPVPTGIGVHETNTGRCFRSEKFSPVGPVISFRIGSLTFAVRLSCNQKSSMHKSSGLNPRCACCSCVVVCTYLYKRSYCSS
jgi:hypothetical protein